MRPLVKSGAMAVPTNISSLVKSGTKNNFNHYYYYGGANQRSPLVESGAMGCRHSLNRVTND